MRWMDSACRTRTWWLPMVTVASRWTVDGAIATTTRLRRRLPKSWADGTRGVGRLSHRDEFPRVLDPQSGRIYPANARVVDGDMLARIGDGTTRGGWRARIIRELSRARTDSPPADLLSISSTRARSSGRGGARWTCRRPEDGGDRPASHSSARNRRARLGTGKASPGWRVPA